MSLLLMPCSLGSHGDSTGTDGGSNGWRSSNPSSLRAIPSAGSPFEGPSPTPQQQQHQQEEEGGLQGARPHLAPANDSSSNGARQLSPATNSNTSSKAVSKAVSFKHGHVTIDTASMSDTLPPLPSPTSSATPGEGGVSGNSAQSLHHLPSPPKKRFLPYLRDSIARAAPTSPSFKHGQSPSFKGVGSSPSPEEDSHQQSPFFMFQETQALSPAKASGELCLGRGGGGGL